MGSGFQAVNAESQVDHGAFPGSAYSWSQPRLRRRQMIRPFRWFTTVLCLTTITLSCGRHEAPDFSGFVDRYLDDFARRHPSIAAGNGLHQHDDMPEDFPGHATAA